MMAVTANCPLCMTTFVETTRAAVSCFNFSVKPAKQLLFSQGTKLWSLKIAEQCGQTWMSEVYTCVDAFKLDGLNNRI